MSRRSTRRLAALLSAMALVVGGVAVTAGADSTIVAGACCSGHK